MNNSYKPFATPILLTRPLLPNLEELSEILKIIWETKWVTNGGKKMFKAGFSTKLYELELALRQRLKVPRITVFNNGTTALMIAVGELFKNGEVITTPFTFPATPHALTLNNITPVFCDIDNETLTIDVEKIESLITDKTTGILGVHVFGMPCNVKKIHEIAEKYHLKVIYDAAQVFDLEIDGIGIGNFGDVSMFSFHATKLFNTIEGGALTYKSVELENRFELLKDFGIKSEDEVILPGINGKLNEIQAAIGLLNLKIIDEEREKRQAIINTYCKYLEGVKGIIIMKMPQNIKHSLQYFAIRISNDFGLSRDEVHGELKKYNVFSRKYFYPLCSEYPYYRGLPSAKSENLPVANQVVKEVLCLPLYGDLQRNEVEIICQIIKEFQLSK
mgnify:CR=1 FL=1